MDQLLERRGDEYSDKQKETMWKVDAAARKDYNAKLAAAYYTSPRFAKDLTLAAANVGLRMGVRQALGFAFAEMWFAVEEEFQACDAKDGHLIWEISLDGLAMASSVDLKMQSTEKREITIEYYRVDRAWKTHRIRPASVMFTDNFFYLIAFNTECDPDKPLYFRVDRIKYITEHRKKFSLADAPEFDEGLLRERSLFMWPGKLRTIQFEFTGSAIQAILDKLPTAKIIERNGRTYTIEAEVYGDGIKMWLLSQGRRVKVTAPEDFVEEMRIEIINMQRNYM